MENIYFPVDAIQLDEKISTFRLTMTILACCTKYLSPTQMNFQENAHELINTATKA